MGMSASQTRVLMLTARQNDLEYQAQQILSAKLAASRQAEEASAAYEEKVSNTHFIMKVKENGEEVQKNVTVRDIYSNGYYIVDNNDRIVLPSRGDYSQISHFEAEPWQYGCEDHEELENRCIPDSNLNQSKDQGGADSYLKEMIDKGEFRVCRISTVRDGVFDSEGNLANVGDRETTMEATADFAEVYYTADDAEAEAKYETITRKLETLEKKLDMQMEQIETERTAVKTEKESVEKVVDENVESTFKTFG